MPSVHDSDVAPIRARDRLRPRAAHDAEDGATQTPLEKGVKRERRRWARELLTMPTRGTEALTHSTKTLVTLIADQARFADDVAEQIAGTRRELREELVAWQGTKSLAAATGCSDKTVQRGLDALCSLGWLVVLDRRHLHRSNVFVLTRPVEGTTGATALQLDPTSGNLRAPDPTFRPDIPTRHSDPTSPVRPDIRDRSTRHSCPTDPTPMSGPYKEDPERDPEIDPKSVRARSLELVAGARPDARDRELPPIDPNDTDEVTRYLLQALRAEVVEYAMERAAQWTMADGTDRLRVDDVIDRYAHAVVGDENLRSFIDDGSFANLDQIVEWGVEAWLGPDQDRLTSARVVCGAFEKLSPPPYLCHDPKHDVWIELADLIDEHMGEIGITRGARALAHEFARLREARRTKMATIVGGREAAAAALTAAMKRDVDEDDVTARCREELDEWRGLEPYDLRPADAVAAAAAHVEAERASWFEHLDRQALRTGFDEESETWLDGRTAAEHEAENDEIARRWLRREEARIRAAIASATDRAELAELHEELAGVLSMEPLDVPDTTAEWEALAALPRVEIDIRPTDHEAEARVLAAIRNGPEPENAKGLRAMDWMQPWRLRADPTAPAPGWPKPPVERDVSPQKAEPVASVTGYMAPEQSAPTPRAQRDTKPENVAQAAPPAAPRPEPRPLSKTRGRVALHALLGIVKAPTPTQLELDLLAQVEHVAEVVHADLVEVADRWREIAPRERTLTSFAKWALEDLERAA